MLSKHIDIVEIELTSKCNARCPGCARTKFGKTRPDLLLDEITIEEFKNIFPPNFIKDKGFVFSGVLGDCIMAKDILPISQYLSDNKASWVNLTTNGGVRPKEFWKDLGKLSHDSDAIVTVTFSVDGHENTNHLYRVNVVWKKLWENMTAYSEAGGTGNWQYLIFEHNVNDLDVAKQSAKDLGFKFKTRLSTRNWRSWDSKSIKKINGHLKTITKTITSQSQLKEKYKHKELDRTKELTDRFHQFPHFKISKKESKSITCKFIHSKEMFIGYDKKVWPCCWFHTGNTTDFWPQLKLISQKYGEDWNDASKHSLEEILNHEYYAKVLADSWNGTHKLNIPECFIKCGDKGSRWQIKE